MDWWPHVKKLGKINIIKCGDSIQIKMRDWNKLKQQLSDAGIFFTEFDVPEKRVKSK